MCVLPSRSVLTGSVSEPSPHPVRLNDRVTQAPTIDPAGPSQHRPMPRIITASESPDRELSPACRSTGAPPSKQARYGRADKLWLLFPEYFLPTGLSPRVPSVLPGNCAVLVPLCVCQAFVNFVPPPQSSLSPFPSSARGPSQFTAAPSIYRSVPSAIWAVCCTLLRCPSTPPSTPSPTLSFFTGSAAIPAFITDRRLSCSGRDLGKAPDAGAKAAGLTRADLILS